MRGRIRRSVVLVGAVTFVIVAGIGLWAFQPWKIFTSSTLNETLPVVTRSQQNDQLATNSETAKPASVILAEGKFVSQEHHTTGTAKVYQLADNSRILRLEELSSSDGPDLHVWLTDQSAGGDWGKYENGRFVKLGGLKATNGNQNYPIPAEIDLTGLTSVVIWCDRFNVAFGSAPVAL